jgi:uncharacterized protein
MGLADQIQVIGARHLSSESYWLDHNPWTVGGPGGLLGALLSQGIMAIWWTLFASMVVLLLRLVLKKELLVGLAAVGLYAIIVVFAFQQTHLAIAWVASAQGRAAILASDALWIPGRRPEFPCDSAVVLSAYERFLRLVRRPWPFCPRRGRGHRCLRFLCCQGPGSLPPRRIRGTSEVNWLATRRCGAREAGLPPREAGKGRQYFPGGQVDLAGGGRYAVPPEDMLETIEKLLILQDRDRRIRQVQGELAHIEPQRTMLKTKAETTQAQLEVARGKLRHLESDRKRLELDVEAKKEQIARYANQQLQTRKNEEYQALSHEIELAKEAIRLTEDEEIALMEQAEVLQKEIQQATREAADAHSLVEEQVAKLATREQNLRNELEQLRTERESLAGAVDENARGRYERLLRSKGENVIVGVPHGVCGGCHMRVPPQLLVMCQAKKELVTCSNCGRILYYTRDMDLALVD